MSFLDQIQQQVMSSIAQSNPNVANLVSGILTENGGLEGLVNKFKQGGYQDIVSSWISKGANLPVSAEQINTVLGGETVKNLAQKMGVDSSIVTKQISEHLPTVIDQLTPNGEIPTVGSIASHLGSVAKNFLGDIQQ